MLQCGSVRFSARFATIGAVRTEAKDPAGSGHQDRCRSGMVALTCVAAVR
ncbi:hypothetical protein GCM10009838_88940 [Catenulispora subtropica]|uniref:Uncharacterized protein n=1 Tax=Catenulispora subtropica TaxID=450798 RepID=A0ABN2THK4_9ACTN